MNGLNICPKCLVVIGQYGQCNCNSVLDESTPPPSFRPHRWPAMLVATLVALLLQLAPTTAQAAAPICEETPTPPTETPTPIPASTLGLTYNQDCPIDETNTWRIRPVDVYQPVKWELTNAPGTYSGIMDPGDGEFVVEAPRQYPITALLKWDSNGDGMLDKQSPKAAGPDLPADIPKCAPTETPTPPTPTEEPTEEPTETPTPPTPTEEPTEEPTETPTPPTPTEEPTETPTPPTPTEEPTETPTPPTPTEEPTETPTPPQLPQPETILSVARACEPNIAVTTVSNNGAFVSGPLTIILTDLRTQEQTKNTNGSLAPGEAITIRTAWDQDYWLEVYEQTGIDHSGLPVVDLLLEIDIEGDACYVPTALPVEPELPLIQGPLRVWLPIIQKLEAKL